MIFKFKLGQPNQRWSTAAVVFGTAVLLADGLFAYFKIETQLKLADLTSRKRTCAAHQAMSALCQ
jgi:hypothetical protein